MVNPFKEFIAAAEIYDPGYGKEHAIAFICGLLLLGLIFAFLLWEWKQKR